jgi:hypothetical protein
VRVVGTCTIDVGEESVRAEDGDEERAEGEEGSSDEGGVGCCRLNLPRRGEAGEGNDVDASIRLGADAFWLMVILLKWSIFVSRDLALPLKFLRSLGLEETLGGTLCETAETEAEADEVVAAEEADDLLLFGR